MLYTKSEAGESGKFWQKKPSSAEHAQRGHVSLLHSADIAKWEWAKIEENKEAIEEPFVMILSS